MPKFLFGHTVFFMLLLLAYRLLKIFAFKALLLYIRTKRELMPTISPIAISFAWEWYCEWSAAMWVAWGDNARKKPKNKKTVATISTAFLDIIKKRKKGEFTPLLRRQLPV